MVLLIQYSSVIVVHSKLTEKYIFDLVPFDSKIERKIKYVPHPDYIDRYGAITEPVKIDNDTKLNLLFMGAVKPYKNIELLIDIAKKHQNRFNLTIAGKPIPESYGRELLKRGKDCTNILFNLDFIDDDRLSGIISNCDLFVLPYDKSSSLNSGTIMLAFSYKKSVISSEIGTVEDTEIKKINLIYNYKNAEEHLDILEYKIMEAVELKKSDNTVFLNNGQLCYDFVKKNNNSDHVCSELINIYKHLV